jgi:hypothetical protein
MKSYTDLEQSKKLAEILPTESADGYWFKGFPPQPYMVYTKGTYNPGEHIPCWSLSALLGLMPTDDKKDEYYVDTESHSDYHIVNYRNCWDGCINSEYSEESLLDAAFEMVVWLKENGKI